MALGILSLSITNTFFILAPAGADPDRLWISEHALSFFTVKLTELPQKIVSTGKKYGHLAERQTKIPTNQEFLEPHQLGHRLRLRRGSDDWTRRNKADVMQTG